MHFNIERYGIGAGAGRFATNIEDIGSLILQHEGVINCVLKAVKLPAIGKAVRCYIDNPHDCRAGNVQAGDETPFFPNAGRRVYISRLSLRSQNAS